MQVKDLIKILEKCDENDELTFIFTDNKYFSWNRGNGLFEASQINVVGSKINGKIALSNGGFAPLVEEDAEDIFK